MSVLEQGNVGSVGHQQLELIGGKLVLKVVAASGPVSADLKVELDGKVLADFLISKIPPGPVADIGKAIEGLLFPQVSGAV
tara:strand:+ start:514 stop:756 length:243 start_codon:yes stop_codon:yes gene_type:complete